MCTNPLEIPEILGTVFKYLRTTDLLNVRIVNQMWNGEASLLIATRKIICINQNSTLQELAAIINENPAQPFRSYELWSYPIDLDNEETLKTFALCGPFMHNLTLNFDKDSCNLVNRRTLRDLLLYYLPNLKYLAIRQLPRAIISHDWIFPPEGAAKFVQPLLPTLKSIVIFSDADFNSNFLTNFLSSTKNLEELRVEYGDEPKLFKYNFISALLASSANLQNLQSLQYFMHDPGVGSEWAWTSQDCETLARMNFKLSTIKLHPGRECHEASIVKLLESFIGTLRKMKLRVHDQLTCPTAINLTDVTLYDYEGSLTFLDSMPNLRHLGLCEYTPARYLNPDNIIPKTKHPLISLNLYGSNEISTYLFQAIASSLPNLRVLHFWHMTNKKLRIVIDKFLKLEELIMNVVEVDDEAITGFEIQLCEQIERLGNFKDFIGKQDSLRQGCHIGDLKNLRRLELHGACLADWKWSPMSDVSVYYGLTNLNNLTSLSLYEFKWITEDSIKYMCASIPLTYLKFDQRIYPEDLVQSLKELRPELRIESTTDEFLESYFAINSQIYAP